MSKVEAAVDWARRGFRVFPCMPDEPGQEGNGKRAKRPAWEGWTEWASTDEATIRGWWGHHEFNVGVLTDNLVVVDIDNKEGKDGIGSWLSLHGAFDTLTVRSPSGGMHLYYTGANVAINQGALGTGLDVRSHHGYVMAPGSTINGVAYEVVQDTPMAQVPAEVVARCKPPGERAANADQALVEVDDPRAVAMAVQAIAAAEPGLAGEQSEAAYKLACRVRDFGVSEPMACSLMAQWGLRCMPPVIGDDLNVRVANAYLYAQNPVGQKHPDVLFGGVVVPPVPELLPTPAASVAMETGAFVFGNAKLGTEMRARPWVLRRLLLRGEITTLIAPGGVGKSLVQLLIAAHLAQGIDMFEFQNQVKAPVKSVIYNAEDSLDEMSMRLQAICLALNFDYMVVRERIALVSGKTHLRLRLVKGGAEPCIDIENMTLLRAAAMDPDVGLIGLDPINKLHTANGNDNVQMTYVMEQLEMLAEQTNCALLLSHHTSKPSNGAPQMAGNADTSQGAAAVVNSSRIVLTLTAPSDDDASRYALQGDERKMYLRLDDAKNNRSLVSDSTTWLRKVPVRLMLGEGDTEEVAGLDRADMHARTEHARQNMARLLGAVLIHQKGQGAMSLNEAAAALRAADTLYDKMKVEIVKTRIQSHLQAPVTLDTGATVVCWQDTKGGWLVGFSE